MKSFRRCLAVFLLLGSFAAFSPAVLSIAYSADSAESAKKAAAFVASKEGGKYHKASCGLAANIKPENKVTFKTKAEAEKAGYTPCGVCKP